MTPPRGAAVRHTALTRHVIGVLDEFSLNYTEDPQHPLENVSYSQVREERHTAPAETVQALRAKLQTGVPVTPVVLTRDDKVIDGNTRVKGHRAEKRATIHALVLDASEADLGPVMISLLGAKLNDHGKRLTSAENEGHARVLLADGATTERVVEHLSIPGPSVRRIKSVMRAEQALERLGMKDAETLSRAHLVRIGQAADLHDEPLRQLVLLAIDANLPSGELHALTSRVREKPSDAEALELIEAERQALAVTIRAHKATGNGRPPASRKVSQAVRRILAGPAASALVEREPERAIEHLETLRRGRDLLAEAVRLQELEMATLRLPGQEEAARES